MWAFTPVPAPGIGPLLTLKDVQDTTQINDDSEPTDHAPGHACNFRAEGTNLFPISEKSGRAMAPLVPPYD